MRELRHVPTPRFDQNTCVACRLLSPDNCHSQKTQKTRGHHSQRNLDKAASPYLVAHSVIEPSGKYHLAKILCQCLNTVCGSVGSELILA
mmetsp:Transcript_14087/g.22453  ORF Transcript_14087/g.22453 Transcript_14087/m.22453 type:complete len:90 (-) Transcript_14087:1485-1754(-)